MSQQHTDPLQVQLNLDSRPTVGALRAFLSLLEEVPNSAPLGLVVDDTGVRAISAPIQ